MTSDEPELVRGEAAAEQVRREPFWGPVRRRHPDLDIAVLPPEDQRADAAPEAEPPGSEPTELTETETDRVAEEAAVRLEALWAAWADETDAPAATGRWTSGTASGTVRHETSRALEGADPVIAARMLDRGAAHLRDDGWLVQEPDGGMPRVIATRGTGPAREDVLLLVVPTTGRAVARYTSPSVPVAARRRHTLLAEGAR